MHEDLGSIQGLCDDLEFRVIAATIDWPDDIWTNLNDPNQFAAVRPTVVNIFRSIDNETQNRWPKRTSAHYPN
jgi:hypothetical protein